MTLRHLSLGAQAMLFIWALGIGWDLICPPGQTLSEAIARGLSDRRTRLPITAVLAWHLVHLYGLARKIRERP